MLTYEGLSGGSLKRLKRKVTVHKNKSRKTHPHTHTKNGFLELSHSSILLRRNEHTMIGSYYDSIRRQFVSRGTCTTYDVCQGHEMGLNRPINIKYEKCTMISYLMLTIAVERVHCGKSRAGNVKNARVFCVHLFFCSVFSQDRNSNASRLQGSAQSEVSRTSTINTINTARQT